MKPTSFADHATVELDSFVSDLRRDKRRQARARGLELTDLVAIFFQERAGEVGSR